MRRGVSLLILAFLAAAVAAAAARASGETGTTTTTSATTTTAATTTTPAPTYEPLAASSLPKRCVGAGAAAIREPGHATLLLGTPASALGASAYPGTSPLLSFDSSTASGWKCANDRVTLNGVSLFGGRVTATSVEAVDGKGTATGLEIDGAAVTATAGQSVAIGSWGLLTLGAKAGRLSAPLMLTLLKAHATLAKGTTIFLAFAAVRQPVAKAQAKPKTTAKTQTATTPARSSHTAKQRTKRHKRKKSRLPHPLKQTPGLGITASHYVFPIDGGASYVDTYGAGRNDIYDGWHHGDDLFAPLGTPVVAVTTGKLSLVGWNSLGGWRIWLTDAKGNSFYYAHLSGYSRWILQHRNVKAGQVIGFLGRTGDAFTTAPHVHFEVHPHELLKLGYDGAVDPTSYLHEWQVAKVPASEIPRPAKLRAPVGTPTQEAKVVWRELLTARHLMPNGEPVVAFTPTLHRPFPGSQDVAARRLARAQHVAAVRTAQRIAAAEAGGPWPMLVLLLTLSASAFGALFSFRRRRRQPAAG